MSNIQTLIQVVVAIAAVILMWESFKSLNNCTRVSSIFIRIPLVLFLSSAVGILVLILSGVLINWPIALIVVASSLQITCNRRRKVSTQSHINKFS